MQCLSASNSPTSQIPPPMRLDQRSPSGLRSHQRRQTAFAAVPPAVPGPRRGPPPDHRGTAFALEGQEHPQLAWRGAGEGGWGEAWCSNCQNWRPSRLKSGCFTGMCVNAVKMLGIVAQSWPPHKLPVPSQDSGAFCTCKAVNPLALPTMQVTAAFQNFGTPRRILILLKQRTQ